MSVKKTSSLQKNLKLISNDNKFRIVQLLATGEVCVCDIGEKLDLEQSLVSHHLRSLRQAGLINDRKLGNWVHCSLNRPAFSKLTSEFASFLGPDAISSKLCSIHEECKCLIK